MLTTPHDLWALRYPETHRLCVLERKAGGHSGDRHMDAASAAGAIRVRSGHLAMRPSVVVASQPMDEDPDWRQLASGELIHVGPDLTVTSSIAVDHPPTKLLTLDDLHPQAAASQQPTT